MMAPDYAGTGVSDNDHVRILRYQVRLTRLVRFGQRYRIKKLDHDRRETLIPQGAERSC